MNDVLVWVDTETTGLEDTDDLLEIGLIVTDHKLRELWNYSSLLMPNRSLTAMMTESSEYVHNMHDVNGLWSDLAKAWNVSKLPDPHDVEMAVLTLLQSADLEKNIHPLCGSTPHFDRRMMARVLPKLEDWFHYRNIDVSSIKELAKIWAPTIYDNRPGKDDADKKHRVLDDIRASIAELKYYIDSEFISPDLKMAH